MSDTATPSNTQPTVTPTTRSAYIDNARAALIALVVFGHLIELRVWAFKPTYLLLYAFHMPAFAFVSGYLAKPDVFSRKGLRSTAQLVLTYIIFQTLYTWFSVAVLDEKFILVDALRKPYWLMWWIISLLCWRLMLPLFSWSARWKFTWLPIVALTVAGAIASGYLLPEGTTLSISRTLVLFPFFLTGYVAKARRWRVEPTAKRRVFSAIAFLVCGFLISSGVLGLTDQWLWGRMTYAEMGVTGNAAGIRRAVHLALSATLVASFLALIPRKNLGRVTQVGLATLPIYIWHGFIMRSLGHFDMAEAFARQQGAAIVNTIVLVGLLSFPTVTRFTSALVAPWTLFDRSESKPRT